MVNVQPFGSYANGLSLAGSDIDVVVTGVAYPDDGRGGTCKTLVTFCSRCCFTDADRLAWRQHVHAQSLACLANVCTESVNKFLLVQVSLIFVYCFLKHELTNSNKLKLRLDAKLLVICIKPYM